MIVLALAVLPPAYAAGPGPQIREYLNGLSASRDALAATLDGKKEITPDDFQRVCAPVGKSFKAWAAEKGYSGRQVARKFRNDANRPDEQDEKALARFERDRRLAFLALPATAGGAKGEMHYVPIRVVKACLHCHGDAAARPAFIREKYPKDLAFGFRAGDLRGAYAVFVPGAGSGEKKEKR